MSLKIRTRVSVEDAAIEDWQEFLSGIRFTKGQQIEKEAEVNYEAWRDSPFGSLAHKRVTAWLVLRQDDPELRFDECDPEIDKLTYDGVASCPTCESDEIVRVRLKDRTKPEGAREKFCLKCDHVYDDEDEPEAPPDRPTVPASKKRSRTAGTVTKV
jgi:hypothetical protein